MTRGSPWAKHCAGTVTVVYAAIPNGVEDSTVDALWQKRASLHTALISEADLSTVEPDAFYENLDAIGIQCGLHSGMLDRLLPYRQKAHRTALSLSQTLRQHC